MVLGSFEGWNLFFSVGYAMGNVMLLLLWLMYMFMFDIYCIGVLDLWVGICSEVLVSQQSPG